MNTCVDYFLVHSNSPWNAIHPTKTVSLKPTSPYNLTVIICLIFEFDLSFYTIQTLRKELDSLKDKASKAEAAVKTIEKTYNEESRGERELQAKFRAADDVRQNVYAQLNNLRRQLYEKV